MIKDWMPLLVVVLPLLITQIFQYFKQKNENKKEFEKLAKKTDIEAVKGDIEKINKHIAEKSEIERQIKQITSSISTTAFNIISANKDLPEKIKTILNVTQKKISGFAIFHRENPYRNGQRGRWSESLYISADTVRDEIKHAALDLMPDVKEMIWDGKKIKVNYDDHLYRVTKISTLIEVLLQRLIENGMSPDEYCDLFTNFTEKLINEQIKAYRKWMQL